jgi:hypothetical protein
MVPLAISGQVRSGQRKLRLNLYSGASTGEELDSDWASLGIIARRLPYMTSKSLRSAVNGGGAEPVSYTDIHLGEVAQNARLGFYGKIDAAIIEAAAITAEGNLIPTTALGCSQTYIELAERVIVELNLAQPAALEGLPAVQSAILSNASRYVKPGGVLLYSTCTLLRRENEAVVEAFLARNPDFTLEPLNLPEPLGSCPSGMLTLWPHLHHTDGFFMARLRRR